MPDMSTLFSGLSFEATKLEARTYAGRSAEPNPFEEPLRQTYENDTALAVTVPSANAPAIVNALRRASDSLGIGVSIQLTNRKGERLQLATVGGERKEGAKKLTGGTVEVHDKSGNKVQSNAAVRVKFAGKDRKQRKDTADPAE